jgi:hypothetical protein
MMAVRPRNPRSINDAQSNRVPALIARKQRRVYARGRLLLATNSTDFAALRKTTRISQGLSKAAALMAVWLCLTTTIGQIGIGLIRWDLLASS